MKAEQLARRRILVVEDDLDQVVSTVLLLRSIGHEVESALNGGAALAAARSFRPHVVLLDIGLPDTMGWKIARQLKAEHPGVRILVITGRSSEADRIQALQAGCEAYLLKPVGPATLESLVAGAG